MIYIYDILLNFNKEKRLYDFYEWKDEDNVVNIKKIRLAKVPKKTLDDFITYNICIDVEFLNKIFKTCELYEKSKLDSYNYTVLLSDGERVFGFIFASDGNIINRSKLLLDEEMEIAILANNLDITKIDYIVGSKVDIARTLMTRSELEIYDFLYKEIIDTYNNSEYSKLNYLYQEYFDKKSSSNKKMFDELIDSLKCIDDKHKELYDLLFKIKKEV